ncbi:ABC transporter permease [Nocardioides sp.]|uniref:ABC transporter permease n=1 Tax=Nocardioides sp. TaxID=35761 RepID=UPI0039E603A0
MSDVVIDPAIPEAAATGQTRGASALAGRVGLVLAVGLVILALLGPLLAPDPTAMTDGLLTGPSGGHLFGTDNYGRDVFARWLAGARPLVVVGWISAIGAVLIGTLLGVVAAAVRGLASSAIMRAVDVMLAFPSLLLAMALVAALGNGLPSITIGIGVAYVPQIARMAYGLAQSVLVSAYVEQAYHAGASTWTVLKRHVVPNIAAPVVVFGTSIVGWAMLAAATLNFLGLGTNPPTPDWGADLRLGGQYLYQAWWMSVFPGVGVMAAVLSANLLGDFAARHLDIRGPRSQRRRQRATGTGGGNR